MLITTHELEQRVGDRLTEKLGRVPSSALIGAAVRLTVEELDKAGLVSLEDE